MSDRTFEKAIDVYRFLCERYPEAFKAKGAKRVPPLMRRIHLEILAVHPQIDPRLLSRVMDAYTGSFMYLKSLTPGTPRVWLDGKPMKNQVVTEKEALQARERLALKRAQKRME